MEILAILIVLIFVCFLLDDKFNFDFWGTLGFIFSFLLFLHVLIWPIAFIDSKMHIERLRVSIETTNIENKSEIERAAIVNKIIELNGEIAYLKKWNSIKFFECYISDEIEQINYIK